MGEPTSTRTREAGSWSRQVAAFYDARARAYASEYSAATGRGEALRVRLELALQLLDASGADARDVLDVGCGPGEIGPAVLATGRRYRGADVSLGTLALARARHGPAGAAFVCADGGQLPFRDGLVDAAVALGSVEYTNEPTQTVAEMVRAVRPGGTVIFSLPTHNNPYTRWKRWSVRLARMLTGRAPLRPPAAPPGQRTVYRYDEHWPYHHLPPGCTVEDLVFCIFKLLPTPLDLLVPRLDAALMRWAQRFERGPLRGFGTAIVIRVRTPQHYNQGVV